MSTWKITRGTDRHGRPAPLGSPLGPPSGTRNLRDHAAEPLHWSRTWDADGPTGCRYVWIAGRLRTDRGDGDPPGPLCNLRYEILLHAAAPGGRAVPPWVVGSRCLGAGGAESDRDDRRLEPRRPSASPRRPATREGTWQPGSGSRRRVPRKDSPSTSRPACTEGSC